jgi:hypothetical protein
MRLTGQHEASVQVFIQAFLENSTAQIIALSFPDLRASLAKLLIRDSGFLR